MKSRHRAREIALQILYQFDLDSLAANPTLPVPLSQEKKSRVMDLKRHFEHFNVPEDLHEFVNALVIGTLNELEALDAQLEKYATHWKVSRMSSIDRSLLRMSVYEMTYRDDVPRTVVIDEAIELAKQFGTAETPAFVNGILDSIKNALPKPA